MVHFMMLPLKRGSAIFGSFALPLRGGVGDRACVDGVVVAWAVELAGATT